VVPVPLDAHQSAGRCRSRAGRRRTGYAERRRTLASEVAFTSAEESTGCSFPLSLG